MILPLGATSPDTGSRSIFIGDKVVEWTKSAPGGPTRRSHFGSCGYPPLETERTAGSDPQLGSAEGGNVTGLSDIPASWGELPANASLQAEIGWCRSEWDIHYMLALFRARQYVKTVASRRAGVI